MQTVLATFDDRKLAQDAIDELVSAGFPRSNVHLESGSEDIDSGGAARSKGLMASVGHFFDRIFESRDEASAGNYAEAVRRGSTVVVVDTETDEDLERAQALMQRFGTVNLDDRAEQWRSRGWNGFDPDSSLMDEDELAFERDSLPVIQEELVVGKREVDVGGLRVVKRVTETPVSEIVNLRQERATVQRTPANRQATEADFQNFREGTFEVRETAEEAVVGKTARVVEEVSIGREVTNRAETIADSVRRTDVDVERVAGEGGTQSSITNPDRRNS